jgi:hypothetical protein
VASTRNTTSRKPRTAARAASRPSTRTTEPEEQDVDEQQPTAAETEAENDYVTADLAGEDVRIIPPSSWRASWQAMLNQGQLPAFVEQVVHSDDLDTFWDIDPTNAEFYEFIEDAARQGGESLGKSPGPGRSSRRTRRR